LDVAELSYPSASAIEFHKDRLYVIGDDAPYLLILSKDYQPIDSVFFRPEVNGRIPKQEKHDIESAMIIQQKGKPVLYGVGSASSEKRRNWLMYDLQNGTIRDTSLLKSGFRFPTVDALNIEGSTAYQDVFLLANRANLSNPENHLMIVKGSQQFDVKRIVLPKTKSLEGISGLAYSQENDLLLLTLSEEETTSTTSDGKIGESYLAYIHKFSTKLKQQHMTPDVILQLSHFSPAFKLQKIESVCIEAETRQEMTLHLVADNDDGKSKLFKIRLTL